MISMESKACETVEALRYILGKFYEGCDGRSYAQLNEYAKQMIERALDHARNCEMFDDEEDAWLLFVKTRGKDADPTELSTEEYEKWLFERFSEDIHSKDGSIDGK